MTKTFADMTPEERAECIGMWCDAEHYTGKRLGIIREVLVNGGDGSVDVVLPVAGRGESVLRGRYFEEVTPRFDLSRAWNADGTPLQATRETITGYDGLYLDARGAVFPADSGITYQRWVTDWEVAE